MLVNKKRKNTFLVIGLIVFVFCGVFTCVANNRNSTTMAVPGKTAGQLLANGDFESNQGAAAPADWQARNDKIGEYAVTPSQEKGKGHLLHVRLLRQSDYGKTLVLYQVLDVSQLRGKSLTYGGEAKTSNSRVNLRLWTPESNDQIEINSASSFTQGRHEFKVPQKASSLIFAVEVVGERGAEAWIDNLVAAETNPPGLEPKPAVNKSGAVTTVTIDPRQRLGKISPLKFGSHLEWINSGHGVWDKQKNEVNRQAAELLNPLHIQVWRFPGGIYSDYYNWQAGIEPREKRRESIDPFDGKTRHKHDLGVNEFIQFLKTTGSEALITANYGTGNLEQTVSWLKHFKSKGVNVRYWEIGNEVYMADPKDSQAANGARIYHTSRQYADDFVRWSDALKAVDRNILVGAIGGVNNTHSSNRDWIDTLLKTAGSRVDFIALHNAFAPIIPGKFDYTSEKNRLKAYRAMLAQVEDFKSDVTLVKKKLKQHLPAGADGVRIAITEHFPIFGDLNSEQREQFLQNLDQTRTMAGALYTASILTAIVNDPQIFMANYLNPIHPYFSALLNTSDEGLTKNPVYFVYYMYRNHFADQLIFSEVNGPSFSTPSLGMVPSIANAPYIDVASAIDGGGNISIAVVNKDLENSRQLKLQIAGTPGKLSGESYTLAGNWPDAVTAPPLSGSTRRQKDLSIKHQSISLEAGSALTVPPCSFTIVKLKGAAK